MECPVVAGLAYANPNDRLSYPDRILSAARHRVASVTANCLHWRDAATVDLMQRGVPVDNLGNCLHNVNESLIVTPATWSADQSTTHAFPSLQANKVRLFIQV